MKSNEEVDEAYATLRWGAENAPPGRDENTIKFLEGAGAALQWIAGDDSGVLAGILDAINEARKLRAITRLKSEERR